MNRFLSILFAVFLTSAVCFGADLSAGFTFADGQRVTAAQLQQLVNNGVILPGFYTGKVIQTNLNATDYILVYSSGSGTYHRVSGSDFLLNNVDWLNTRPEKMTLNTNDFFPILDTDGGVLSKVNITNIWYGTLIPGSPVSTNFQSPVFLVYDGGHYWQLPVANLYTNFATNWYRWLQLGPTNGTYTNLALPLAPKLSDTNRFWTADGTTNESIAWAQMKASVTNCSIIGEARDLVMQSTNATIQLLTCTDMVLKATNGASYCTGAFTLTNNLSLTTPTNGVDTGVAGVISNWYYIHVMSDGTNLATIASLSSNNPALPPPFIYRAMAGPAFYGTNSAYYTNYQTGRTVALYTSNILSGAVTASYQTLFAANGSAGIFFSNAIPPIAFEVQGTLGSPGTTLGPITALATDASGLNEVIVAGQNAGATVNSFGGGSPFRLSIKTPQTIWIKAADTAARNRLNITGYRF